MSFPSAPTNGQQATLNNVVYIYNSTKNAWVKSGTISSTIVANALIINNTTISTSTTSGAVVVAGGMGVQGNINSGNLTTGDLATGNLTVATNLTVTGNAVIGSFYSNVQRVAIDFGNTSAYNTVVYISDSRAQVGAKVFVTPSAYTANSSAQLGGDELEFDNFFCAANVVAAGNIAVYITAFPGPVKGQRNFDYILG
jgi:hypothetical protein